jgi:hypothetical protein
MYSICTLIGAEKKEYAYHPDPERERGIGNDSPRLCLECGAQTMGRFKNVGRSLRHVQFRQILLYFLTFKTTSYFDGLIRKD